ncbi:bis(5'-adenosyl)-triphosphatase ENPP4 [Marmota monax]|uniref:bis(5'-adenosyl)-triphosphatase n=1 Tax=Marmota monax TaxID=9995 RepID=A0A834UTJ0_MARMO|nr:bis(5'-adenosyl)-triphosphatase ENPP4 [Marmota monax]
MMSMEAAFSLSLKNDANRDSCALLRRQQRGSGAVRAVNCGADARYCAGVSGRARPRPSPSRFPSLASTHEYRIPPVPGSASAEFRAVARSGGSCGGDGMSVSFEERVNNITTWLSNSNPPVTFATLYWEEPDASGHKYGPEDKENMHRVLKKIDDLIGYLVQKLKMLGLWENLNVIITSDHGMTQCSENRWINLDLCIDRSNYSLIDLSPVAAVLPKINITEVYEKLKNCSPHMNVYLKKDIPNRYYYQHNDRIQPIILVADEGWTIVLNKSSSKLGDHGYDNSLPSMHPFLAAHGPAFHKGYKYSTINIVDIYPMMCHILGLKPHPNNGTFSHTKCLLVDQWCINLPEAIGIVIGALLALTTLTCLIIIMQNRLSVPHPFSRLQLQEDDDDPLIG